MIHVEDPISTNWTFNGSYDQGWWNGSTRARFGLGAVMLLVWWVARGERERSDASSAPMDKQKRVGAVSDDCGEK